MNGRVQGAAAGRGNIIHTGLDFITFLVHVIRACVDWKKRFCTGKKNDGKKCTRPHLRARVPQLRETSLVGRISRA